MPVQLLTVSSISHCYCHGIAGPGLTLPQAVQDLSFTKYGHHFEMVKEMFPNNKLDRDVAPKNLITTFF